MRAWVSSEESISVWLFSLVSICGKHSISDKRNGGQQRESVDWSIAKLTNAFAALPLDVRKVFDLHWRDFSGLRPGQGAALLRGPFIGGAQPPPHIWRQSREERRVWFREGLDSAVGFFKFLHERSQRLDCAQWQGVVD